MIGQKDGPRHMKYGPDEESTTVTVTATTTTTSVQQQRLQRATDPEVMGENNFDRNRRSIPQVSTASTVATSPKSTSSNSVQIVQSTAIDLKVKNIEDLIMADVQEQKAASDNEASVPKDKAAKGKRKHVATENLRGRPQQDPRKDDRDKGQGLA
jgi:hypothetical protein